ncbi:GrpB family protein [Pseudomonadota bacterium]
MIKMVFVENMNAHPNKAKEYQQLKLALVEKYKFEPNKYSEGKSNFINLAEAEAIAWKSSN